MASKSHRSSRRSTRRVTRKNRGLTTRLYSPIHQSLMAANNVVGAVTNTAGKIVKTGIRGVNRVGTSVTGRLNKAVRGLVSRKSRRSRRNRR